MCDALAQTVQASRFTELLETINEALESTFRELLSSGDLEHFLKDRGWKPDSPLPINQRKVRFEMPFDLKGVKSRDFETALC